jgi:hypothetical protein
LKFKQLAILGILISIISAVIFSYLNPKEVEGWYLMGSAPEKYEIGVVLDEERNKSVSYLSSTKKEIVEEFGTISQSINAHDYLGNRLKLTADIKSEKVTEWAGMWMRVDGKEHKVLAFDNMQNRSINGTNSWTNYSVVLDVPKESISISYGVLLSGTGTVWVDDLSFKTVDNSVTTTGMDLGNTRPRKPRNNRFK